MSDARSLKANEWECDCGRIFGYLFSCWCQCHGLCFECCERLLRSERSDCARLAEEEAAQSLSGPVPPVPVGSTGGEPVPGDEPDL